MNPRVQPRSAGVAALAVATLLAASACGGSAHPGAAGTTVSSGIQPGAGQSLAGAPGATASGPATGTTTMPGMTMTMPTGGGSSGAVAAPVSGNAVTITGFAFAPAALTVKAGTTVTWTNKDADAHTVTSQKPGPLRSAPLDTGQTYSYTFTAPGTYAYLCTIHPFMTATVTVTP